MADKKAGAYGAASHNDPSFRRTWDREEYAAKAKEREKKSREEGKARHEAALAGKRFHRRASTPPDARETESRAARLDVSNLVGKQTIVAAGASTGKRGRGAGFYCEHCDLTFKDNLQLIEHYNSKQHLQNTGQTGQVRRATLEEVRSHLARLKEKAEEQKKDAVVTLSERLALRKEIDDKEREEKRRKRNEKRRKTKDGLGIEPV